MTYSGLICVCVCVCVCIYSCICAWFSERISQKKITLVLIIKLMELSCKIEILHFRVSDIAERWVVTELARLNQDYSIPRDNPN